MNDKAPCCPFDVINYMKINHVVNVSYDKAWRGCEIALNSIRGTPEDSYAMLAAFTGASIRNNPDIIYISNTMYSLLSILLIMEMHILISCLHNY